MFTQGWSASTDDCRVAAVHSGQGACRVRVRSTSLRYLATKPFALQKVELFEEEYQGPYTGGTQLPMSCGAEHGLSSGEPLSEDELAAVRSRCQCAPSAALTVPLCNALICLALCFSMR